MWIIEAAVYTLAFLLLAVFYIAFLAAGIVIIRLLQNQVKAKLISVTWAVRIFIVAVPALAAAAVFSSYIMKGQYHSAWVLTVCTMLVITLLKQFGFTSGMEFYLSGSTLLECCPVEAAIKSIRLRRDNGVSALRKPRAESFYFTAEYGDSLGRNVTDSNLLVKLE